MSELKEITDLGEELRKLTSKISDLELQLATLSEQKKKISELRLPELMMAAGMESFTLEDGTSMTLDTFYNAKIPEDRQIEAFTFLESTGQDAIIKSQVSLAFGKGEREKENIAVQVLTEAGVPFERKRGIHPMTLKAFVKDAIESGQTLPLDAFGVFIGKRVKVRNK